MSRQLGISLLYKTAAVSHLVHSCVVDCMLPNTESMYDFFFKFIKEFRCYEVKIEKSEKAGSQSPRFKTRTLIA